VVEQPTHNRQVRGSDPHPSHQLIPTAIRATVRDYIRAHHIFEPGPVVVAVSGGADSTALLLLLADLADELGLVLHVAHFDHRTRPKQSALDADFVAKLANRVGAPIRVGRAERATTSEDDARRARYEFLRRAAREIGATAIATGHTRDDQAETVLLHLTRGTGLNGLAGMRALRNGIARPLLTIGRKETAAVCRAVRIRPRTDPTNRSLRFARNRIRGKVLPELAKINPRVVEAIARFADAAVSLDATEASAARAALDRATTAAGIALDGLPTGDVRDEALALAWERATGRPLGARHRAALARLVASTSGSRSLDLPGGRAVREYGVLRIVTGESRATTDGPTPLEAGRETVWNGWRIGYGTGRESADDGDSEALVPESVLKSLVVRSRADGDRIGDPGRRKLQDLFTDAKVPAAMRPFWPVIATENAVFWVPFLTSPPRPDGGTRLAVAAPKQMGNVLWSPRVREVASKAQAVARRPRRGPRT
jgi:tRNA(Ile)-lysidine synthase